MNSSEHGGRPSGEDDPSLHEPGQDQPDQSIIDSSPAENSVEPLAPIAPESLSLENQPGDAERIAQLRQEINALNADVQASEVMAKHGSVDENQSNRDKTYNWVESQVLAKENEIRQLERQERRRMASPRIEQLKSEIEELNRNVAEQTVMTNYGGVPGNESNRDKTYGWVESQVLAKEDEIRKLEESFREPPQNPDGGIGQTETEPVSPEPANVDLAEVPPVPIPETLGKGTPTETLPTPSPDMPNAVAPRVEQAESGAGTPEAENQETLSVADARTAFAKALHKRGNFFGKTSDEAMEQLGQAYLDAIAREQRHQFQAVTEEFQGREMNEQTRAEHDARLVAIAASTRHEEENALSEALKEQNEQSRFGGFKKWWRKHPKLRLAGSVALMGVSGVSLATGNLPAFAGSQALRTALSGVSTGMAVESGAEMVRNRFGETKKLSAETIQELEQGDLERYLAAQTIRSAELGQGTEAKPLNDTAQALRQEYERRNQTALVDQLQNELKAGTTMVEITEKLASDWLKDQGEFHKALESRRDGDRRFKTIKAVGSVLAGLAAGYWVYDHGADKAHDLASKKAKKMAAGKLGEFVTAPSDSHGWVVSPIPAGEAGEMVAPDLAADMAKHNAVEVVEKGDTVGELGKRQIHERLGDQFDNMDEARQTHMIDAIKDRIVANPQAFGLENADQLQVGDKVDMTSLFEGKDAVQLDAIRTEALDLDQGAVDNILKNNELLRDWVADHPKEALDGSMVEKILAGEAPVTETGATLVQAEAIDPVQQKMVANITERMTEQMLCELQEKNPVAYAQAHADNPELYPDRAGLIEKPVIETIELNDAGTKALKRYGQAVISLHETTTAEAADKIVQQVGGLTVGQALRPGVVEKMVDGMEGGTEKAAATMERTVRSVLRSLPKGEYLNSEKVVKIFERLPKAA